MAEIEAKKLFTEFPPVTTEQWEAEIQKDLKGADYEKKLVWNTLEGFKVRPYYRAEDLASIKHLAAKPGEFPYVRGTKATNDWLIRQQIVVSCPKEANTLALDILMKGVNSLNFVINSKEFSAADLDTLLNQISIKSVELNFSGCGSKSIAPLFIEKVRKAGLTSEDVVASFAIDPIISKLTLKGKDDTMCSCGEDVLDQIVKLINSAKDYRRVRFVTVNAVAFNNAGASIVEELAFALAVGHDYLVELMKRGLTIDEAARNIKFDMSVGSLYFLEIAKFRAARMLWATIVKQYNPENECSQKMRVHATTSLWNTTVYDPYVNMLRGTTESMSAAIAGVSSIEVLPFDSAYETPTLFALRIARNIQLLLKEETHIDHVADAAGGSYYVETLTQTLSDYAWEQFKEVEAKGGYSAAFKAGYVVEKINATAAKRNKNLETRKDILLGTNQYPNFTEKVKSLGKDNCGCSCKKEGKYEPLRQYRAAEPFEAVRLKTDAAKEAPKAFMLTVGSVTFARARSQFASNFFACAGIEPIDNLMFATLADGIAAAKASKAEIVVLCSSDDEYATYAPEAFEALGKGVIFVVAGAPACQAELEAKGIKNFISVRSNVLETLREYQKALGI